MDKKDYCILVVDDEPEMREMIANYLEDMEGYRVLTAENGVDALENVLPKNRVDLVLSDINMPKMKGFELLNEVRGKYPKAKRVLITAYNVEDYLELAITFDVGNIFVKTTPFNFKELSHVLENLLSGNVFGPERYFEPGTKVEHMSITRSDNLVSNAQFIINQIPDQVRAKKLELVIVELLTNAIFYGVRRESPEDKDSWEHEFELSPEQAVTVSVMSDPEKYSIAITDNGGRLTKKDILYFLNRQANKGDDGLPLGIMDSHGRGLFIARKYIDRLIINIEKDKKTEIIIINYLSSVFQGYKPIYINEI
jgi:CheY-like chemotaxis protein/anti-sigma regulatory factor (Ser/Thr protein kinase)